MPNLKEALAALLKQQCEYPHLNGSDTERIVAEHAEQIKQLCSSYIFEVFAIVNPQLSDAAWEFLVSNEHTEADPIMQTVSFTGDLGNWNWLLSELWKRGDFTQPDVSWAAYKKRLGLLRANSSRRRVNTPTS